MKTLVIAALAAGLACGTAAAQSTTTTTKKETTGQSTHAHSKRGHKSADGYYRPGIPKADAGRYKNLPGKDADFSKAYIQDH